MLALTLIALGLPSATASADTTKPASVPTTPGCHHGAGIGANAGLGL
jgi:hypothetical protein